MHCNLSRDIIYFTTEAKLTIGKLMKMTLSKILLIIQIFDLLNNLLLLKNICILFYVYMEFRLVMLIIIDITILETSKELQ